MTFSNIKIDCVFRNCCLIYTAGSHSHLVHSIYLYKTVFQWNEKFADMVWVLGGGNLFTYISVSVFDRKLSQFERRMELKMQSVQIAKSSMWLFSCSFSWEITLSANRISEFHVKCNENGLRQGNFVQFVQERNKWVNLNSSFQFSKQYGSSAYFLVSSELVRLLTVMQ